MSEPVYIGQVAAFAFPFAPRGWAKCDGSLLSVVQYPSLFSLLGTLYGGDGVDTFGLPNLYGRAVVGSDFILDEEGGWAGHSLGQYGGAETVALIANNLAQHSHALNVSGNDGLVFAGEGYSLANAMATPVQRLKGYRNELPTVTLHASSIGNDNGYSEPFNIRNPFLCLNYCICIEGTFPTAE